MPARADVPESIKPYLSEQTVGIVRLNIATLDWAGFSGTLIDALHNAGAGKLYIVGSFQLIEMPILVLIPNARDTAGVVEVMQMLDMEATVVGGLVRLALAPARTGVHAASKPLTTGPGLLGTRKISRGWDVGPMSPRRLK